MTILGNIQNYSNSRWEFWEGGFPVIPGKVECRYIKPKDQATGKTHIGCPYRIHSLESYKVVLTLLCDFDRLHFSLLYVFAMSNLPIFNQLTKPDYRRTLQY